MTDERDTQPGPVLRGYERAKAKIGSLIGRGKGEAKALMSGDEAEDGVSADHDWKGKEAEAVSEAEQVRSQEEMKETFDGDGVMPSDKRHKGQKDRGQKEGGQKEGGQKEDGSKDANARTDLPDGSATAVMKGGAEAEDNRTGETRRADEADLSGTVDDGGPRGEIEAQAPDVHAERAVGTDDNPAAPAMSTLDKAALAKMSEDEVGRLPDQGLGLDDGPGVSYPSDVRN